MRLEYDFRGNYTVLESDGIYGSYSVLMTLRPSRQLIRLDDLDKLCHQGIWVEMCWGGGRSFVIRCKFDWPTMLVKFYEGCEQTLNSSPQPYYSMTYEIAMRYLPNILLKISMETVNHMFITAHR
jgi:hypothetical protein